MSSGVPSATTLAAVAARAGTEVDDPVGRFDRRLVVLDDEHRVAEVAQAMQRADQALVVALVQADRRLVEHVQHARQLAAELRREPDALRLAARQRARRAMQRQVVEPDVEQERQPVLDLLEHLAGDLRARAGELHRRDEVVRLAHRHAGDLDDRLAR